VLLKDFAGCEIAAIVEAIDLRLSDLFVPRTLLSPAKPPRPLNGPQAIRDGLQRLLDREEAERGFRPAMQTRHIREARATLARVHHLGFQSVSMAWWETEPHASDPAWTACVSRALEVQAFVCGVDPGFVRELASRSPIVATKILNNAASLLRSITTEAA